MKKDFLSIKQVKFQIANSVILHSITCDITQGKKVAILGNNGSGKSTFLKLLCGILQPSAGSIQLDDYRYENIRENLCLRKIVGYAPDKPPLYAHDTVMSYLYFIAQLKQISKSEIMHRIEEYLTIFELEPFANNYIYTLSKGIQQRINLAQALISKPKILILDEPTNSLDQDQSAKFINYLKSLPRHITIIMATHNYVEVTQLCDYILKISNGTLDQNTLTQNTHRTHHHDYINC